MTAQQPDRIVLDGEVGALMAAPLEDLLHTLEDAPRLVAPHTACWRGHVASWRVEGDRLFLDDVQGWVEPGDEVGAARVLPGVELPLAATWVHGTLRVGFGPEVRHVHADFDSRMEREVLLDVTGGIVTGRRDLATPAAMGTAGPYRIEEPLLGLVSGGGFGQLLAASDVDGRPLVAKAPRPSAGTGGTEIWNGDRPIHVPAKAFGRQDGTWGVRAVGMDVTAAVLRAEAELLDRDGGVLLPKSLGLWEHEPSGVPVLVMERLAGSPPQSVADVRAVLAAVADAVDRGTFDAHGDLKAEHVFVDGPTVRICDPAPRFDDPTLRAYTPTYNPGGWTGPAADAVACASMLRFLPDGAGAAARWADSLLASIEPPGWAYCHRDALAHLDEVLASGPEPGSPEQLRAQWPSAPQWPSGIGTPAGSPFVTGPGLDDGVLLPPPFPGVAPTELALHASIDRILIAAVDLLLGSGTVAHPKEHATVELVDADTDAVQAALASVVEPSLLQSQLYGVDAGTDACTRLFWWGWGALGLLDAPRADIPALSSPLPRAASTAGVAAAWSWAFAAHEERRRELVLSDGFDDDDGDEVPPLQRWLDLVDTGTATTADLLWTTASLVTCLARWRRGEDLDAAGGLASVLDALGRTLPGGVQAWSHPVGAIVERPPRYGLRTALDPGSGSVVWSNGPASVERWDYPVDHFDLPIPAALAHHIELLVDRLDLDFDGIGTEHVPFAPGEAELFARRCREVMRQLRDALGSAYVLEVRDAP